MNGPAERESMKEIPELKHKINLIFLHIFSMVNSSVIRMNIFFNKQETNIRVR